MCIYICTSDSSASIRSFEAVSSSSTIVCVCVCIGTHTYIYIYTYAPQIQAHRYALSRQFAVLPQLCVCVYV